MIADKHIKNGIVKLYEQKTVEGLEKSLSDTCNGWTTTKGEIRPGCPLNGKCNKLRCEAYQEWVKLTRLLKIEKEIKGEQK